MLAHAAAAVGCAAAVRCGARQDQPPIIARHHPGPRVQRGPLHMTKFVFVTGGVVSSLGKGIAAPVTKTNLVMCSGPRGARGPGW